MFIDTKFVSYPAQKKQRISSRFDAIESAACELQTPATLAVPKGHQDLDTTAATELPSPEIIGAFSLFQIDKLDMELNVHVNLFPWA